MRASLATLQHLNPGVDAFMRRVIDTVDQADLEDELQDAMEQPSLPPSHQPVAQPRAQTVAQPSPPVAQPAPPVAQPAPPAEPAAEPAEPAAQAESASAASDHDSEMETDTDDDADDDKSSKDVKCSVLVETHPLPILQKTVPLPLNGPGAIKYRKNLAYGKVLFKRFTRAATFSYPLKGYFFIRVDAKSDTFFRMYGEINKETNVGDFVIPRDVVQTIESKLHMLPKEKITIAAVAAGIDPGPGYKFKVPAGHFALLITKA